MISEPHDNLRSSESPPRTPSLPTGLVVLPPSHRLPAMTTATGAATSASDVTTMVRHWWWKCLLLGVAASAICTSLVWFTFTPIYEATAWMEIKEQPLYVAFEPRSNSNASLFFKTQLQTMQSPVVLARVGRLPEIAGLPEVRGEESVLAWLERGLKASFRGESELCDISFRARHPDVAAKVANAIMEAYLVVQRDHYGQQTERIIELLTEEKRRRADELEQLQERVRVLTKKSGRGDATAVGQKEVVLVQNPIAALEARKTAVEVERVVLEAELNAYQADETEHAGVPADVLEQALETDPEVTELKNQLIQAKSRLRDRKRVNKSEDSVVMQKMAASVNSIEESLTKLRDELRPKVSERLMLSLNAQRGIDRESSGRHCTQATIGKGLARSDRRTA